MHRWTLNRLAPPLRCALAVLAVLACTTASAQAYDTSGAAAAIAELNAQRAANGIPAVTLDESLLQPQCTEQNHQIASGGMGPDGFSGEWTSSTSPWDGAPLHQSILYNPTAADASYAVYAPSEASFPDVTSGTWYWACMWFTWPNWDQSPTGQPEFYAYTAETGRVDVPISETTYDEWPTTPQALAGLPADATTGPNLLVYALGIGQNPHIASATLTSASGASVPVDTIDGTTPWNGGTIMFGGTGDVIPVSPLQPSTSYTATVDWQDAGSDYTQTFSFTTAADPGDDSSASGSDPSGPPSAQLVIGREMDGATAIYVSSRNRNAVTLSASRTRRANPSWTANVLPGTPDHPRWVQLPSWLHGSYVLCGSQASDGSYAGAHTCTGAVRVNYLQRASYGISAYQTRIVGPRLRFSLRVAAGFRGGSVAYRVCTIAGRARCGGTRRRAHVGATLALSTNLPPTNKATLIEYRVTARDGAWAASSLSWYWPSLS